MGLNRHDSSDSEGQSEASPVDPQAKTQLLQKRKELEESDASIDFSNSDSEVKSKPNTLNTKLKDLETKEKLMGKHAETVVRGKDGQVADLRDSRQVKLAEIDKLNQRIVGLTSWTTSSAATSSRRNSEGPT